MLIFILPSAFYIKLVKKEPMKSVQKIGVSESSWPEEYCNAKVPQLIVTSVS